MLRYLVPFSLLIALWILTEISQAEYLNTTQADFEFKVRDRRQIVLKQGPGRIDPHCQICGVSASATLQARVINGIPVKPRWKYPWAVPTTVRSNKKFSCGGALISNQFVLTAAHCIRDPTFSRTKNCVKRGRVVSCYLKPHEIKVAYMGSSHNKPLGLMRVGKIYLHPRYDYWNDLNDIALLKLERPVRQCNRYISPICLPRHAMSKRKQKVVVAGWGRVSQNIHANEGPQMFREGRVTEVAPSRCQRSHNKERDPNKIYCTQGLASHNHSSCQGDSGTSVFASFDGVFYSLGVTSVHTDGRKCPIDGYVSFASTFGHMDFIRRIVGKLPQPPRKRQPSSFGRFYV